MNKTKRKPRMSKTVKILADMIPAMTIGAYALMIEMQIIKPILDKEKNPIKKYLLRKRLKKAILESIKEASASNRNKAN